MGLREAQQQRSVVATGVDIFRSRQINVRFADGGIAGVDDLGPASGGPYLAPGLVDLQVGGANGASFNAPDITVDTVRSIARSMIAAGTTTFLPNVTTNDPDHIEATLRTIAAATAGSAIDATAVAGVHLEGPFISPEDGPRGAHNKRYVRAPDWELFARWQDAAGGMIRVVTVSPEWPNAIDFIHRAAESGVLVAIGHTAATPQQIRDAIAAGARLSTHLGNGSHIQLPRHHNYLWEQLASDALSAALIADGAHLPDAVLRVMLRTKKHRAFLVSDASALTGAAPGEYLSVEGRNVILTDDNHLVLAADPDLLAGSVQLLRDGVAHLTRSGMATLPAAWAMASVRPAGVLGVPVARGLTIGAPADLVSFDWDGNHMRIREVFKGGRPVLEGEGSA